MSALTETNANVCEWDLCPFCGYSAGEARSSVSLLIGLLYWLLFRFFKTSFLMLFLWTTHTHTISKWWHLLSDTVASCRWSPGYEGSIGERGLVVVQAVEQLGLGGARWRQRFWADPGRRSRGQLVVSGSGQSLLSRRIGWLQPLSEHKSYPLNPKPTEMSWAPLMRPNS